MSGTCRRTGVAAAVIGMTLIALSGCIAPGGPHSAMDYPPRGCATCQAPPSTPGSHVPGPRSLPKEVHRVGYPKEMPGTSDIQQVSYLQDGQVVPYSAPSPLDPSKRTMPIHPGVPGVPGNPIPGPGPCPHEISMVSHPPYTIAPPDIITIDAVRLIPRPPYRVEPLEVLLINVTETLPNAPIAGPFVVAPDGSINLGFNYGSLRVAGLTLEQIQTAIRNHLSNILRNPQVTVALAQFRGLQQIRGQHLVRPDGTISLGTYGSVYVAGMTLGQAKCVIEKHLSEYLLDPQLAIDVFSYNSKVYYVILDGGGFGQQVIRLPVTGNETVLDAIANIQGLAPVSSKHRLWLARPSPVHLGCNQILPIDWMAITMNASTATNYQIFPGDRIYVSADRLIALDNWMSKVLAPVERALGITLLGATTRNALRFNNNNNQGVIIVP